MYLCIREGGGWVYEKTHEYAELERVSKYTSVDTGEIFTTKYYAPECSLVKMNGFYYLNPVNESSKIYLVENGSPEVFFCNGYMISQSAKIGIATGKKTSTNKSSEEKQFSYEYFDFYDKVDELIEDKHWKVRNDGKIYFDVNGEEMLLCPIITFDQGYMVDSFLESNQQQFNDKGIINRTSLEGEYNVGICKMSERGDYYYIEPRDDYQTLHQEYNDTEITFGSGIKISPNAKVGVATRVDFGEESEEGYEEPIFKYEYYNFYDVVDKLLSNKHWQTLDAGNGFNAFSFELEGMAIYNTLKITLDENGEISLLLDYYQE